MMNHVKENHKRSGRHSRYTAAGAARELKPLEDLTAYVQEYARQRPEAVALACLGVGFILGWKLKLW
jgi:hypothetical protein